MDGEQPDTTGFEGHQSTGFYCLICGAGVGPSVRRLETHRAWHEQRHGG